MCVRRAKAKAQRAHASKCNAAVSKEPHGAKQTHFSRSISMPLLGVGTTCESNIGESNIRPTNAESKSCNVRGFIKQNDVCTTNPPSEWCGDGRGRAARSSARSGSAWSASVAIHNTGRRVWGANTARYPGNHQPGPFIYG